MPRGSSQRRVRAVLPFLLVPLAMLATGLAAAPWLRAYPADVLAVPLFGAAVLSVLTPVVVVGIGVRRLWLTALVDVLVFVFFTTLVGLHDPVGLPQLWDGLLHGPSQILSFALPLVSPRTLLVAPMALCWVVGAVLGECVARSWHSVVPYATLLVAFGLSYAGSVRGVTTQGAGRHYDVLLAAVLLLTLLVMRAVQAWIEQDLDAEVAQPDGRLPLRGLAIGMVVALAVSGAAAALTSSSAFSGPPVTPDRQPPLDRTAPLSPVAFVAGLRPHDLTARGTQLFSMRVDRTTSNYVAIADVDDYDGAGWTFHRTFRPSGGAIPGETDPTLRPSAPPVTQRYTIDAGALTRSPWMPFLYRPQQVSGMSVDVDGTSGMIVPARTLRPGESYSVTSDATRRDFGSLPASSFAATSEPPDYTFIPADVAGSLGAVLTSFEDETRTQDTDPVAFLQALTRDLRSNYALSGRGPAGTTSPSTTPARASTAPASSTAGGATATGGTGFATVLASILGPNRAATPEQYATLVALIARQLGLPARLVSGFRVGSETSSLRPGRSYDVTTADAWTWVEIPIQGRGWVVLDPSPARAGTAAHQSESPAARPTPTPTPTATPNGLATQSDQGHAVAPRSRVPGGTHASTLSVLVIVLGSILLGVVLAVGLLWGRKWLRVRRRRRSGDPRARLLGAWHEGLDVLVESGLGDPTALTSDEIAVETGRRFGPDAAKQARFLGYGANVALFSPTTSIGRAEADAAWQTQTLLRRTVRRELGFRQRVGAQLRYRRTRRVRRITGPESWAAPSRPDGRQGRGRHASGRHRH